MAKKRKRKAQQQKPIPQGLTPAERYNLILQGLIALGTVVAATAAIIGALKP